MPDADLSAHICEQVHQAHVEQASLSVCGASSKPWRQSVAGTQTLSVAEHCGVVSYDPTELVVTVRAGTSLAELDQVLALQGQMLAAECPDFAGASTIGGALALGWSGSRAPYAGSLRDFVLGARMVNGLGEVLRFGGQVMKNVAGYDISRLLSGSLGCLGVILEVSLKLLPLPEREMTRLFEFESQADSRRFALGVQRSGEPLTGASYCQGQLRLRFSGQDATLQRLALDLGGQETDNDYWRQLRCLQLPQFTGEQRCEPLYDWNGGLCWSRGEGAALQRQVGNTPAVDLRRGPQQLESDAEPLAQLQRRIALAFDPGAVFQVPPGSLTDMRTALHAEFLATDSGREADSILRACVHCGFCSATCPTYQVDGNELDSPRGRIYLIKEMLEGAPVSAVTRTHLDRCLTCQSCETTCPSGVNYHRLLDIGRAEVERRVPRALPARALRWALVQFLTRRHWFVPAVRVGRLFRPVLPAFARRYLPPDRPGLPAVGRAHTRRMILVQGCVQPGLSPATHTATRLVLDRLGVETVSVAAETCCGALAYHLSAQRRGLQQARANIDAWWPLIEEGVEAIVMNASGCSNFVQDYAQLLSAEPAYADRARRVVELLRDVAQVLQAEDLSPLALKTRPGISWHCPCTAQHGQQLDAPTRNVLQRLGFDLPQVADAHLCCGSAGTYSLLQPRMAKELRERKLLNLQAGAPEQIVTANIGCQTHLAGGTDTPVVHWIEMLARELQ